MRRSLFAAAQFQLQMKLSMLSFYAAEESLWGCTVSAPKMLWFYAKESLCGCAVSAVNGVIVICEEVSLRLRSVSSKMAVLNAESEFLSVERKFPGYRHACPFNFVMTDKLIKQGSY